VRRRPVAELLDTDSGTAAEVAGSLQDLRWFNRWFGGVATSRHLLELVARASGKTDISILEVAAGDGFVPQTLQQHFAQLGLRLHVTLLDRAASHLPRNGGMGAVSADALILPFQDSSFDVVSSSLFVHHLSPDQVVKFLCEVLRVCRVAVVVNDLVRHPLHLAIAVAGAPLYRSRLTRHDAPASVRQAYTVQEMRDLFEQVGAASVELHRRFFFRMGVIAWKQRK
jgi:ubiquinone/menaquinone biosynthesis C-methylase UbiE